MSATKKSVLYKPLINSNIEYLKCTDYLRLFFNMKFSVSI